jgi:hypothetical protein
MWKTASVLLPDGDFGMHIQHTEHSLVRRCNQGALESQHEWQPDHSFGDRYFCESVGVVDRVPHLPAN